MKPKRPPWKTEEERRAHFIEAFNMQSASGIEIDEAMERLKGYLAIVLGTRRALAIDDRLWNCFLSLKKLPLNTPRNVELLLATDFGVLWQLLDEFDGLPRADSQTDINGRE